MSNFETKANELLEIADKFRNEIKSKAEVKAKGIMTRASFKAEQPVGLEASVGLGLGLLFSPILAIMTFATLGVIGKLIKNIQESPQGNYTTKEISAQTGIEEWKLRRYIASQKLKAESNKSSDGNPGRSGYSISKNNLIEFIKANESEIARSKKTTDSIEKDKSESKSEIMKFIDPFLARIDPVIELGNLEIKLAKLEHPEESKEVIAKEILLQNLKSEKLFFEEQRKYLEQATLNWLAESSTEQATETK
ncbi:MAG: hypothetical protein IIT46_03980 [Lachnospiraceae bacterium]|nr:hypothetical protein [Lachnospiraceae bacterium]